MELNVKDQDLEKFSVEMTELGQDEVANLPNGCNQFVSTLHDIKSQRSMELNELVTSKEKRELPS